MKHAPRIITRGKYAYECNGHFVSKGEAIRYKNQTLHSLLVVSDEPKVFGVGVKYHVYRRLS
uniref:Uncharacterized protein n=1 Tax=viral metagenome TaxID=1070528 RepID=A0A6M3L5H0_9ZZZZ